MAFPIKANESCVPACPAPCLVICISDQPRESVLRQGQKAFRDTVLRRLKVTMPQNGRTETGEVGATTKTSGPVCRELGLGRKASIQFLAVPNMLGDLGQLILSLCTLVS